MIIFYLAILLTGIYWVVKNLGPEMAKPPLKKAVSNLVVEQVSEPERRMDKLEILILEKNKNIQLLQTELKVFQVQVENFDKIKILLEGEINRLREQNRIFRSELGLPTVQAKENSII